jgi:hypothetical protein
MLVTTGVDEKSGAILGEVFSEHISSTICCCYQFNRNLLLQILLNVGWIVIPLVIIEVS